MMAVTQMFMSGAGAPSGMDWREALRWLERAAAMPGDHQEMASGDLERMRKLIQDPSAMPAGSLKKAAARAAASLAAEAVASGGCGIESGGRGGGGSASTQAEIDGYLVNVTPNCPPPRAFFDSEGDHEAQLAIVRREVALMHTDPMAGRAAPLLADDATGRLVRSLM